MRWKTYLYLFRQREMYGEEGSGAFPRSYAQVNKPQQGVAFGCSTQKPVSVAVYQLVCRQKGNVVILVFPASLHINICHSSSSLLYLQVSRSWVSITSAETWISHSLEHHISSHTCVASRFAALPSPPCFPPLPSWSLHPTTA
jgi:hypothetical protein